jgi:hypothetical protein
MIEILGAVRDTVGQIEVVLTDAVAKIAPWTAPIPTAYLVGRATVEHLGWPVAVGIVVAIIVESLGLATSATALELREYNASKRKSDPRAPFALATVLVAVYLAVAVGLTVALDIAPVLGIYSPAIFPFLSLTGVTVLAIRGDHRRRVEGIEMERAARRSARNRNRKPTQKVEPLPESVSAGTARYTETGAETKKRARVILEERPGISGSELGRQLGRSERLGRKLKAELMPGVPGNRRGSR